MATIFVKPVSPDRVVRYPASRKRLPVDGAWVERNSYWSRRLRDGDVTEVTGPPWAAAAETEQRGVGAEERSESELSEGTGQGAASGGDAPPPGAVEKSTGTGKRRRRSGKGRSADAAGSDE